MCFIYKVFLSFTFEIMTECLIKAVDHLKFSIFKNEEVEEGSVCEINQANVGGANSVYAPELGCIEEKKECATCGGDMRSCPGHFGHISLNVPIPHPFYKPHIAKFSNVFCKNKLCNRLLMKKEHVQILVTTGKRGHKRLDDILDLCAKNEECPHCEEPNGMVKYCPKDNKFFIYYKGKEARYPFTFKEISVLFKNIREKDLKILGFKPEEFHPKDMLIEKFPVSPPAVRLPVLFDGNYAHDDITYKYIEIIKANNKLKDLKNEKKECDLMEALDYHISTIMDNTKKKVRDNNNRIIKCFSSRISGKKGHIRKYICGKRTDFCARTVIGPEVNCMVDEVIIPPEVAQKLTIPVTVNSINMEHCKELIKQNKVNYIISKRTINGVEKEIQFNMKYAAFEVKGTALVDGDIIARTTNGKFDLLDYNKCLIKKGKFELKEGDRIWRNRQWINAVISKKREITLKEGDIVERQLQNGDWVVLNRQPSLRAESMRAKKVRIIPGKTFRFNLASTEAYNADFDGDKYHLVPNRRLLNRLFSTSIEVNSVTRTMI